MELYSGTCLRCVAYGWAVAITCFAFFDDTIATFGLGFFITARRAAITIDVVTIVADLTLFEDAVATGCGYHLLCHAHVLIAGIAIAALLVGRTVETHFVGIDKTSRTGGEPGEKAHSRNALHPNLLLKLQLKVEACAPLGGFYAEHRLRLFGCWIHQRLVIEPPCACCSYGCEAVKDIGHECS